MVARVEFLFVPYNPLTGLELAYWLGSGIGSVRGP